MSRPSTTSACLLTHARLCREIANAMIGVKTPLVMSSRSDSALTKLYTMALSVVLAGSEET